MMMKNLVRCLVLIPFLFVVQVNAQTFNSIQDGNWGLIPWNNSGGENMTPAKILGNNERVNIYHEIFSLQDIVLDANKTNASITIFNNGLLRIANNGKFILRKNAVLNIKKGGELSVGSLVTENNGRVDIIVSGTLRAEKVILKNEASIDYDLNFSGEGNLFIDELEFQGSASGEVFGMDVNELKKHFESDGNHFYNVEFSDVTLPIELSVFDANVLDNHAVQISWTTLSETNNEYFVIEKSNDLIQWEQVDLIYGAGNSYETNYYEVIDYQLAQNEMYYRLCQFDFDGSTECFDVVSLKKKNQTEFAIYPNPAPYGQPVMIQGNPQTIEVFNTAGQSVIFEIINNQIKNLEAGTYVLSLDGELKKLVVVD